MAIYANPLVPVFEQKKIIASNIAHSAPGTYTAEQFATDFPQFTGPDAASLIPSGILDTFIDMVNSSVFPDAWGSVYPLAAGLFVAHHAALYLSTYAPAGGSAAAAAGGAENVGVVKTATMGDTSVSYDNSAVTAGTEKWGTWNATKYGAQLVTMARSLGIAGSYVI